jgi:hypothetical protein
MNPIEYRLIRKPTKVITKQNTSESASRLNDIFALRFPAFIHSHTTTEYDFTWGNDLKNSKAIINVKRATIPIELAPINPVIFRVSLCPKRTSTRKLISGIAGISAIYVVIARFILVIVL